MTNSAINELKKALMDVKEDNTDSFRHSDLYKLLRNELTRLGYWRKKPRGNPQLGYENSPKAKSCTRLPPTDMNSDKDNKTSYDYEAFN